MRLALQLGHVNVDQMLGAIDANQLYEWMAYAQVEPFGEERADLRMAISTSSLVNVQMPKGKSTTVDDFLPKFNEETTTQSPQEMEHIFRSRFPG